MSDHDLTPERLDAILDGEVPATDDDARDMLALAAQLRAAVPGADDTLRARVRALPAARPARLAAVRRLLRSGWRGRLLVAAPALSAVLAGVIAVGVLTNTSHNTSSGADNAAGARATAQKSEAAATATLPPTTTTPTAEFSATTVATPPSAADTSAAEALTIAVPAATLPARIDDLRRIVTDAGGTLTSTDRPGSPAATVISLDLPTDRVASTLASIATLGTVERPGALSDRDQPADPAPVAGAATPPRTSVQVVVVEAP